MTSLQQTAIAIAAGYAVLSLFQTVYVWWYARRNQADLNQADLPGELPKTTDELVYVVLCVRGNDPTLAACLKGIATQQLPRIQLVVCADDEDDPALATVQQHIELFSQPPIITIAPAKRTDRSLKCNSLLQAFRVIREQVSNYADSSSDPIVILVDADTSVATTAFGRLIAPLSDSEVVATTGSRWFTTVHSTAGTWMRQIWNAAAIVQMELYSIPWGGLLAFRFSLLDGSEWGSRLEKAFCEDTLLADVLRRRGQKVFRVPRLVSDNRESASMPSAFHFIRRQLLTTRLYHPDWPWVVAHGLAIATIHLIAATALVFGILTENRTAILWIVAGWLLFQVSNLILLRWLYRLNRRWSDMDRAPESGRSPQPFPFAAAGHFLIALAVLQAAHPWAVLSALFARKVKWRGVEYQIQRDGSIRMSEYRPVRELDRSTEDHHSIE